MLKEIFSQWGLAVLIAEQWGRGKGGSFKAGLQGKENMGKSVSSGAPAGSTDPATHGKWAGASLNLMLSPQNHHQDL